MFPARQWGLVDVVPGGADDTCHDERTDGHCELLEFCAVDSRSRESAVLGRARGGYTRLVREHWCSVAANQRRTAGIYFDSGVAVDWFFA